MDNLSAHSSKYFINSIIKIIYTFPYSPEINPIELYFNTIKSKLRKKDY